MRPVPHGRAGGGSPPAAPTLGTQVGEAHPGGATPAPPGHASKDAPDLGRNATPLAAPSRRRSRPSRRLTEAPGPAHTQPGSARGAHSAADAPQDGCCPPAARLTNGSEQPRRQIRFKIAHQPITRGPHPGYCARARARGRAQTRSEHAHYDRETPRGGHFD